MTRAALELYSIKELMAQDVFKTLEQVAKVGYDTVEFAGFYDKDAQKIKDKLDEVGLKVCGSHTGLNFFTGDIDELFAYNNIIGNKNLVLPGIPKEMWDSKESWVKTAKLFTEFGKKCKDAGFQFAYHNHSFEFDKFDGATGYDIMLDNVDFDYVKLQPDMGWVVYGGNDPLPFMEKIAPHILNIHAKQIQSLTSPEGAELDRGYIDYKPIIAKAISLGVEDIILEQESFDMDMIESIKISYDFMKSLF